jgi:hypothetical protein
MIFLLQQLCSTSFFFVAAHVDFGSFCCRQSSVLLSACHQVLAIGSAPERT